MNDSLFFLTHRHEAIFQRSFEYSTQVAPDTLSYAGQGEAAGLPPLFPDPVREVLVHPLQPAGGSSDWVFYLVLAGLFLLAVVKYLYEKRFGLLLSSIYSRSSANHLVRETSIFGSPSFIYLLAIFLVASLVLIHQVFQHFNLSGPSLWKDVLIYLQIIGAYFAFLLIQFILVLLAGFLFKNPETAREYIHNIIIFNLIGGVLLLPLILLIHYSHRSVFLYVAFSIISILLLIRFIRGFIIGLSDQKFSLFHLFLYLCTLEILPVLVVAKFIDKYFFS